MEHTDTTLQRARLTRNLVIARWGLIVLLALIAGFAMVMREPSLTALRTLSVWQPLVYVLGLYAAANVFLALVLGRTPEESSPATATGAAVTGIAFDVVFLTAYAAVVGEGVAGIVAVLFVIPILECTGLFGMGMLVSTTLFSLVGFLLVAQQFSRGEVFMERLLGLGGEAAALIGTALVAAALQSNLQRHSRELSHTRQLTETVVENLPEGVLILDGDRRILYVNAACARILAIPVDQLLGLRAREHLALPIRNVVNLQKVLAVQLSTDGSGSDVTLEYPEERLLSVQRLPLTDASGRPFGEMVAIRDVTRDALLNKIKSDFISVAAHQLRTPLSSIRWAFDMLDEGGMGPLTPEQRTVVAQGLDTTGRLVHLVNSLLDVSRMEEGRFGYAFGEADAGLLIAKAAETLAPKAAAQGVTVVVTVPENLPPIAADPEKMEMVLQNLMDNAVSYTLKGGTVRVEAAKEEKFLRVTVSDTGVGIPGAQQQLLFSKFFRGDNVIRMQTEGSGLGLYIAKNIVERHGGTLALTSREGQGTTVSVTIPLAR